MPLLRIDGSLGEGGGQILRTSLALSAITGRAVEMFNIRARRKPPGLRPQHLQAVTALAKICQAQVEGTEIGSSTITFKPGTVVPGDYHFDIGTAGSVSLVLQTLFLPLCCTAEPSKVEITGGTHVPWSPCFHYLNLLWRRYLHHIGLEIRLEMSRAGFYPRGGGSLTAYIEPAGEFKPLALESRGQLIGLNGLSAVGNLPRRIAERQKAQAEKRLTQKGIRHDIELVEMPATGQGTMFLLVGEFENSQCCYYSLGEIGKRAEKVADEACDSFFEFLETEGVFDEHLADQIVLPLALAKGNSRFVTPKITLHLLTNLEVIKMFLPVEVDIKDLQQKGGVISIKSKPS